MVNYEEKILSFSNKGDREKAMEIDATCSELVDKHLELQALQRQEGQVLFKDEQLEEQIRKLKKDIESLTAYRLKLRKFY